MHISVIFHKLIRAGLIIGISLFFLQPFYLPFYHHAPRSGAIHTIVVKKPRVTIIPTSSYLPDPVYTSENLGINLPWLDTHDGKEFFNWLGKAYRSDLIENDLADIEKMGITKVRTFCQMESIFEYKDGEFQMNQRYAQHLDDYLDRAKRHHISVICVMGDGNYEGEAQNLDGHLHLELIQTLSGREVYKKAYQKYITYFKKHDNILMWEIHNEPYGLLSWSKAAKEKHVTRDQMHAYLKDAYSVIKPLVGSVYVGFSDLEEKEQEVFQNFSSDTLRKKYIDDVTDVYAMHIYRGNEQQIFDFSKVTTKPKWVLELGSYNYNDPDSKEHPLPAAYELYDEEENYVAVVPIARKLQATGFSLIMPWGFTSNFGMVEHNRDGTHTLKKLTLYMKEQLQQSKQLLDTPTSVPTR